MTRKDFRFKQFNISDENSAMKVGTDAVLLGASVDVSETNNILDVGTGSGIVATMLAQRSKANIDAIDIDKASIEDAQNNFHNCPWKNRLTAIHSSLQEYVKITSKKYDLIVSNPPFFSNSLKSLIYARSLSKHDEELTHKELLSGVKKLINSDGRFNVILPFSQITNFKENALIENFYCSKQLIIYPKYSKPANRIILEFSQERQKYLSEAKLTIRNNDNSFTKEYTDLTREFYFNF